MAENGHTEDGAVGVGCAVSVVDEGRSAAAGAGVDDRAEDAQGRIRAGY
jgi:hypothetical protein